MKIIVGLGNPGTEYEKTNHNAGFLVLDEVANHFGVEIKKNECKSLVGSTFINGEKFLLVKPQTYMNNSGEAVQELVHKYKINTPTELVVISDDFDTKEGTIRIRNVSGNTTHNGVRNIKLHLNTAEFIRIKVSIAPRPAEISITDFVLSKIKNETTFNAIKKASLAVIDFMEGESLQGISQKYSN